MQNAPKFAIVAALICATNLTAQGFDVIGNRETSHLNWDVYAAQRKIVLRSATTQAWVVAFAGTTPLSQPIPGYPFMSTGLILLGAGKSRDPWGSEVRVDLQFPANVHGSIYLEGTRVETFRGYWLSAPSLVVKF